MTHRLGRRALRVLSTLMLVSAMGATSTISAGRSLGSLTGTAHAQSSCGLGATGNPVQHVIYIQFDNVHFTRDLPNVPSDLEQMPHLLNFLEQNGTLLTNHHTPLIAHTAVDILTSLTGVYGDRMGMPIGNSFKYFNPDGTANTGVSFAYWTDPLYDPSGHPTDTTPEMVDQAGTVAPAPWVPFTRAGCDVGSVAMANTILENTATDIPTVFGAGSPQAAEVKSDPAQAFADFVGIGIHCAQGSALCAGASGAQPDVLPNEPGGYSGYQGLFGNKYVAPVISPGGPVTDINGNVVKDAKGHIGFPGFDGISAAVSLGYVADMQEHGVPVTYAYISDAHDNHAAGTAYGPGEAGYVKQLKAYDDAFAAFFARLAADGINQSNTLFVVTADENDHFVGGPPSPAGCDGVNVPCTYKQIGEINVNATGLLATQQGITTPFSVHSDSAPNFYLQGNPPPDAPVTRTFERAVGNLTATNPLTGNQERITNYLADPVEMRLLHMVTADPARTPTFTMFARPDYYVYTGAANCTAACVTEPPAFAWNHGDVSPDINRTWLGMAGPGVRHLGVDPATWSDHADIRPTIMALTGLQDDYVHDGRVLLEVLDPAALSPSLAANMPTLIRLGQVYKQINAAVATLGLATLDISTHAIMSTSAHDIQFYALEYDLASINARRDTLAGQIQAMLEGAEFGGQPATTADAQSLIGQAQALLMDVNALDNALH